MNTQEITFEPAAWAVAEARKADAFRVSQGRWTSVGREAVAPKTEPEIMAEAAELQEFREAYQASPLGLIMAACREFDAVGSDDVAQSIRSAMSRGSTGAGFDISARECGVILKVLDGMNTSTARAVIQAVGENLRSL